MIVDSYQQLLKLVDTPEYDQVVMIEVVCENVKNLPDPLPASLQVLDCSENQLTGLPSLPSSLQELYCNYNQLTSLPALPSNQRVLNCYNNQLTSLPSLPSSLQWLNCDSNQLTSLPSLPSNLRELYCGSNKLTSLPSLPASLRELYCHNNQLTSLPSLPSNLGWFNCHDNLLPFTDISSWRLLTRIRRQLYLPAIVKLQQRWRQRKQFQVFKEELLAAIYHPDNPCGPAKQIGQTWMEARP